MAGDAPLLCDGFPIHKELYVPLPFYYFKVKYFYFKYFIKFHSFSVCAWKCHLVCVRFCLVSVLFRCVVRSPDENLSRIVVSVRRCLRVRLSVIGQFQLQYCDHGQSYREITCQ